jgi:protein phosphatase
MSEGKLQIKIGERTDPGNAREKNEDDYCISFMEQDMEDHPNRVRLLVVVADGIGGEPSGDLASVIAINVLKDHFEPLAKVLDQTTQYLSSVMNLSFNEANRVIHQASQKGEKYSGMGTTLTAAFVRDKSVVIGHVGDSRAYLIRDWEINQITKDHSLVAEKLRRGQITKEEARVSSERNIITRSVGVKERVTPELYKQEVKSGDVMILCTDGLTDLVRDEEILATVLNTRSIQQACDNLVELANERGGYDNITVIGLEFGELTRHIPEIQEHEPTTPVEPEKKSRKWLTTILVILIIAILAIGGYFIKQRFYSSVPEPGEKLPAETETQQ